MKTTLSIVLVLALAAGGVWWLRRGDGEATAPVSAPPPRAFSGPPADRLALLVGIDRYAPSRTGAIEPLQGCVNDVQRVRTLLVEGFGFLPENVLLLTDEQATHENIVRAFDGFLIRRALPDAEVLFYFSGHGSRTPDRSGDRSAELDGMDSSYLAHDSRAGGRDGEYDLTDDELRSLVACLDRRTPRVTVITDACHSGGGLRGVSRLRTRSVAPGTRAPDLERPELLEPFFPADAPLLEDGADRALKTSSIHIAACGPRQLASELEIEGEDGEPRVHGALTYFLTLALEHAPEGATFGDVSEEAARRLSVAVPGQSVWCEGGLQREVFGGGFHRRSGFPATVQPSGDLSVRAGSLLGLRAGSQLAVYAVLSDELLGEAAIEHTTWNSARATWASDTPVPESGRALRVVELGRPAGQEPLRIRAAHPGGLAGIEPGLFEAVAADGALAEYELESSSDGEWTLATREGQVLCSGANEGDLAAALRRELRYRALLALAHEPGALQVEARFESPTAAECQIGGRTLLSAEVRPRVGAGGAAASGECEALGSRTSETPRLAMIRVRNPHDEDLHVAVISIAEDRTCHAIWPYPGARDNELAPGSARDIPVGLVVQETWPFERPMRDRYLVVATRSYFDPQVFEQDSLTRGARADALPGLLELALNRGTTRGAEPVDGSAWGVTTIELLVTPD